MRSYAQLYAFRRTPSFLPYVILASSRIYLAVEQLGPVSAETSDLDSWLTAHAPSQQAALPGLSISKHAAEALQQNIASLEEMALCHRSALVGLRMLKYLTRAWRMYSELKGSLGGEPGAMGQTATKRAVAAGRGVDFFGEGRGGAGVEAEEERREERAREWTESPDLLRSALFWPAARVPPVIVPVGADLEALGFERYNEA